MDLTMASFVFEKSDQKPVAMIKTDSFTLTKQ